LATDVRGELRKAAEEKLKTAEQSLRQAVFERKNSK